MCAWRLVCADLWAGWALWMLAARIQASEILEASMEAGLTLREVEDIVFSNTRTLEFFNSADLEQVCWRDG